jgi:hypothetical protein
VLLLVLSSVVVASAAADISSAEAAEGGEKLSVRASSSCLQCNCAAQSPVDAIQTARLLLLLYVLASDSLGG